MISTLPIIQAMLSFTLFVGISAKRMPPDTAMIAATMSTAQAARTMPR